MRNKTIVIMLLSTSALVGAGTASAQGVAPGASSTAKPAADTATVGEIVVTAQKRVERLQDVGLSVTAVSGQTLANQRIASVGDLAQVVPGFVVTPSPTMTPVYTLRGVGFYETSVAAYPDVAGYIDQAPLPLPSYNALTTFDLDRVEVVKGPQGTLFGNNATGGAINFIAAKPTDAFHAGMEVGYGSFDTTEGSGYISGPLTDTLDARLSAKVTEGGPWQYDYLRNDHIGRTDEKAARLQLNWHPNDRLTVLLNVNGWIDRDDPVLPQLARPTLPSDLQTPIGTRGATGVVGPNLPILSYPMPPAGDARATDWSPSLRPFSHSWFGQTTLNTTYDFSSDVAVTSITDFIRYGMKNATDNGGVALIEDELPSDHAGATTFSQELRLANRDPADRLKWVFGGNFEHTTVHQVEDLAWADESTGVEQGFTADTYSSNQKMNNYAVFGNVEYAVYQKLTLKAGVRYTEADRTTVNNTIQTPGYVEPYAHSPGLTNLINYLWANVYAPEFCPGVTYVPITPSQSVSINPKTCQAGTFYGKLDEDNVSWSTGVDYKLIPGLLFYVNVAKGYKAGSFPTVSGATQAQYAPVKQESVLDFEGGVKADLMSHRVVIDLDAFHYDYTNKQLLGRLVDPLFGLLSEMVNVPKSEVTGAEADVFLHPAYGLDIRISGTYLSTEVDQYTGVVGTTRVKGLATPVTAPFAGVPLPFSPKFSGVLTVDYRLPQVDGYVPSIGFTASGQSTSYSSPVLGAQNVSDATIKGYGLLDLRAGIQPAVGNWKVMFW